MLFGRLPSKPIQAGISRCFAVRGGALFVPSLVGLLRAICSLGLGFGGKFISVVGCVTLIWRRVNCHKKRELFGLPPTSSSPEVNTRGSPKKADLLWSELKLPIFGWILKGRRRAYYLARSALTERASVLRRWCGGEEEAGRL